MPIDIVEINVVTQAAALPKESFTELAIAGHKGTGDTNVLKTFYSASEVSAEHGTGSDLYRAAAKAFAQGVKQAFFVNAEETAVVDEAPVDGVLLHKPLNGDVLPAITVAAVAKTVVWVNDSPIGTVPTGEVHVNPKTGEVKAGDAGAILVDYTYVDWTSALAVLEPEKPDILILSDTRVDKGDVGDMDALLTWSSANMCVLAFALKNAATQAEADAIRAQLASKYGYAVAHQSPDDVGAAIGAIMATVRPWFTMMWREVQAIATTFYPKGQVGKEGAGSTFEGSSVNVLVSLAGNTRTSNGLSTAGAGSNYRYVDVTRTEAMAVQLIEDELVSLRLRAGKIPFTPSGILAVKTAVETVLQGMTDDGALASYVVTVPDIGQVSSSDKANRLLKPITVTAVLAGEIQSFSVDLFITI